MKINPLKSFCAEIENIAADKSISHRFAIFSLLSGEENYAKNFLLAEDTLNSLEVARKLGAEVEINGKEVKITPPKQICSPNSILECGNSGTTMRLMIGFLSGVSGFFALNGDKYLNKRPMKRVSEPLRKIGAQIYGREDANFAPLCILGGELKEFKYESTISSAQIKTAMILAGFKSAGKCYFGEPFLSRNHSENMLLSMQAPLKISENGLNIEISPLKNPLKALEISIPNDPSSAFYFVLAALILPNSEIKIKNILLNKTRIEAYKVLEKMGAQLDYKFYENTFEDIGEITARSSNLRACEVSENISWLIDEAPGLAIAFACADGISVLKNAKELRVKESDRISAMVLNLQKFGIEASELEDGFKIKGANLTSKSGEFVEIQSFGDHRIAMSFAILGLKCGVKIDESECINTSFPEFSRYLKEIGAKIEN